MIQITVGKCHALPIMMFLCLSGIGFRSSCVKLSGNPMSRSLWTGDMVVHFPILLSGQEIVVGIAMVGKLFVVRFPPFPSGLVDVRVLGWWSACVCWLVL